MDDFVDFGVATAEVKAEMAERLIRMCCRSSYTYCDDGDGAWFARHFARDCKCSLGGGDCFTHPIRTQGIKSAAALTSYSAHAYMANDDMRLILVGGTQLANAFLLPVLEHNFRVRGRYLDVTGRVQKTIPPTYLVRAGIGASERRVNQLHRAFVLYICGTRTPLAKRLRELDRDTHLANRFERIRNPYLHGEEPDTRAECLLYVFLVALMYYQDVIDALGGLTPRGR